MSSRSLAEYHVIDTVHYGYLIGVLTAIKQGASPRTKDDKGNEIVLCAANIGDWNIVYALIMCGADVEAQSAVRRNRLMHIAAIQGS